MADVEVTIPYPVLVGAEKFKTRYRLIPGAFGANTDRTNAAFTLTGLAVGSYEIEIIYVNEDGIECAAILRTFEVIEIDIEDPEDPFECIAFTYEIRQDGSLYYLHVEYPIPVTTEPPCGWNFTYHNVGGGNPASVNVGYQTLPASGFIDFPLVGNYDTLLVLNAFLCDIYNFPCIEEIVPKIPVEEIECEPLILFNVILNPSVNPGEYTMDFDITTAATGGTVTVVFTEESPYIPFGSGISGTFLLTLPPATSAIYPITGIMPTGYNYECIKFTGKIIDFCENEHPFCVSRPVAGGGLPCNCIS